MNELAAFFARAELELFESTPPGRESSAVESEPKPLASLDFYRVLVARNLDKILRELFAPARVLIEREHPGLWPTLVREYARAHPPRARDPNWFGEAFADWLVARREAGGELSALYEELVDYQFTRFVAASGPDLESELEPDDADFERRIFIRHYSYPVARVVREIRQDPTSALPDPRPTTLMIVRSLRPPFAVSTHAPTLAELAVLARRQALELPPAFAVLSEAAIAEAEASLIARAMLRPATANSPLARAGG